MAPNEARRGVSQDSISLEARLHEMNLHNHGRGTSRGHMNQSLATGGHLPPHMQAATAQEKQNFVEERGKQHPQSSSPPIQPPTSPTRGRRRPNQSYRRHNHPGPHVAGPPSMPQNGLGPANNATRGHHNAPQHFQNQSPRQYHSFHQPFFERPLPHVNMSDPAHEWPYSQDHSHWHRSTRLIPQGNGRIRSPFVLPAPPAQTFPPHVAPPVQRFNPNPDYHVRYQRLIELQLHRLQDLALSVIAEGAVDEQEIRAKDAFRARIEVIARDAIVQIEPSRDGHARFDPATVELVSFGSLSSGFALKSSDMDLMLLSPQSQPPLSAINSPVPRALENAFLKNGWGARLLSRTRVPIIRLCEQPPDELLDALTEQREQWEQKPDSETRRPTAGMDETKEEAREDSISNAEGGNNDKQKQPRLSVDAWKVGPQKTSEDIWQYFSRAKKALSKVQENGGLQDKGSREDDRLNAESAIAEAFISGLNEQALRERVRAHASLQGSPQRQSLQENWIHVEGEQIVMAWEFRILREATNAKEVEGESIVQNWRNLHHTLVSDRVLLKRPSIEYGTSSKSCHQPNSSSSHRNETRLRRNTTSAPSSFCWSSVVTTLPIVLKSH